MAKVVKSDIEGVLEKYLALCNSAENKLNAEYWTNSGTPWLNERWRGISAKKTGAPFTMALDIAGYSQVLGFNCLDYYGDPDVHLYEQMRYHLWEAEHLRWAIVPRAETVPRSSPRSASTMTGSPGARSSPATEK